MAVSRITGMESNQPVEIGVGGRGIPQALQRQQWDELHVVLKWAYEGEVLPINLKQDSYGAGQAAYLIREGRLTVRTGKGSVEAGPGMWVFPREGLRVLLFDPGTRLVSIRFTLSWPGEYNLFAWDVALVLDSMDNPQLEKCALRLIETINRKFPTAKSRLPSVSLKLREHLEIQRYFLDWLQVYLEVLETQGIVPVRLGQMDPRVLEAARFLDRFPWHTPFKESALAESVGLSVSQITRVFRKQFGCTPREYRESQRLEKAVSRLQHTPDGIKEIAHDLGFHSPSHFASWLRRKLQRSPSQLRQQKEG